jgi:hypothetical protein
MAFLAYLGGVTPLKLDLEVSARVYIDPLTRVDEVGPIYTTPNLMYRSTTF